MANSKNPSISDLKNHVEQEVTLAGWLYKSRSSGKVQFLIIRDGTGLCQCIVEKSKTRRYLTEFWMVEPKVAFIDLDGLLDHVLAVTHRNHKSYITRPLRAALPPRL